MIKIILVCIGLAAATVAHAQQSQTPPSQRSQTPPFCHGSNYALQFSPQGWVCAAIAGVAGPQGPKGDPGVPGPQGAPGPTGPAWQLPPSPTDCITAQWDGVQWVCVPTNYLEAR